MEQDTHTHTNAAENDVPWDDVDGAANADCLDGDDNGSSDPLLCEGYLKKIRGWGQNRQVTPTLT